jgi:plastocyanin
MPVHSTRRLLLEFVCGLSFLSGPSLKAQAVGAARLPVTALVKIIPHGSDASGRAATKAKNDSDVAVWLTPYNDTAADYSDKSVRTAQLVQRNKTFEPHVLVVQVGTDVSFPNKDPFFHNIFSLFNGKRFDLGLYEAGSTRVVHFDRMGISYLFCNIHPEMSAVVITLDSPYFGVSDLSGHLAIPVVPNGRYRMHVWYERSSEADLKSMERDVSVTENARSLGTLRVPENPNFTSTHKNKYGEEYVPPPTPGYIPH